MLLDRFREAQATPETGFDAALQELRAGRKRGHWIWYIFPQLSGLGMSPESEYYALGDSGQAREFICDPVLGSRLARLTAAVATKVAGGKLLQDLMASEVDTQKLVSSLTLFELVIEGLGLEAQLSFGPEFLRHCKAVLSAAEQEGFPRCPYTLRHAGRASIAKSVGSRIIGIISRRTIR